MEDLISFGLGLSLWFGLLTLTAGIAARWVTLVTIGLVTSILASVGIVLASIPIGG